MKISPAQVPSDISEKKALLVLGMHRSGTSAVTRVLSMLGMDLPTSIIGPSENNPAGYWESSLIRDFNDDLLAKASTCWHDWTSVSDSWFTTPETKQARTQAFRLLQKEFGDSKLWAIKDPRICRLAPFWLDALKLATIEPRALLVVRNPLDVSASLEKRNAFTPAFSKLLWLRHVLDAERFSRNISRAIVLYEDVLQNWRQSFHRAEETIQMGWFDAHRDNGEQVDEFLDPDLRHHFTSESRVRASLSEHDWFHKVYEIMLRWSRYGEQKEDFEELDRVRSELERAGPVFYEAMQIGQSAISNGLKSEQSIHELKKKIIELEQSERNAKQSERNAKQSERNAKQSERNAKKNASRLRFALEKERQHRLDITEISVALLAARRWPRLTREGRLKRDKKSVLHTGLFDADFYLEENRSLAGINADPLAYFIRRGLRKGHAPRPINLSEGGTELVGGEQGKHLDSEPPSENMQSTAPTLNWVTNPDNIGWAYGNNARTIAKQLPEFQHIFDGRDIFSDVALYFDIRIFQQCGLLGKRNVLRVGGPRPIQIAYEGDMDKLKADIAVFDAIIVLNQSLYDAIAPLHPSVHLIPNALDLENWRPSGNRSKEEQFTVGFAGNRSTRSENEIKGYAFVEQACEKLNLPILSFGKDEGAISHDDMKDKFFEAIDVLVHPVAPGKEGCSNVVMESLAMGVPVVTTRDAGFHAEQIADGHGILYCTREMEDIVSCIERLRTDVELRGKMRLRALEFVRRNHDIRTTAQRYRQVLSPVAEAPKSRNIAFVPFWEPVDAFASARLRCVHPANLLATGSDIKASLGFPPSDADIILVSQLASDATMTALHDHPETFVVYDVCDRYFADDREVGGVHARTRFFELAERADVIVTSTSSLKQAVCELRLEKPVVYIPDGIDYREFRNPEPSDSAGPVVWFGNPGRGNFESSRWMIDYAMDQMHRDFRIISRKRTFRHLVNSDGPSFEKYYAATIDWEFDKFVEELRNCSVSLISHSLQEKFKSSNRLITSVANGVPAVVSSSPSCAALLEAGGCGWAVVQNEKELERALETLEDPLERVAYLERMQAVVEQTYGAVSTRKRYELLVRNFLPKKKRLLDSPPIKALFVSHNLNIAEGAPTSLLQTVVGLKAIYGVEVKVFSVVDGPQRELYEAEGIEVIVPDLNGSSLRITELIARHGYDIAHTFTNFIKHWNCHVVIANTAKSLWFSKPAAEAGVPTLGIIRESSIEHIEFQFGPPGLMEEFRACLYALSRTVFVSEETRKCWLQHHDIKHSQNIPNGIQTASLGDVVQLDKAEARTTLGMPQSDLLLLSVGTINARKAQNDIVEAFALLPEETRQSSRLVLVGARPSAFLDDLLTRINELDETVTDRIHIIPETKQVDQWYAAADIFVFSSHNESYPRVIVEAMASSLPVISSDVFGAKEQIKDGENGLLYPIGDVEKLSEKMNHLIMNEQRRSFFAERSATRFWELTSYCEMVHQYYVAIADLASKEEK